MSNDTHETVHERAMRLGCSRLLNALYREHPKKMEELEQCQQLRKEIDLCRNRNAAR